MNRAMLSLGFLLAASSIGLAQDRPEPAKAAAPAVVNLSPLTHEIEIDAPVAKVWDVFSTEEGFKAFGVAKVKVDFRIGGKIQSHYSPEGVIGDEGTIENTILAFEPLRMVAFHISKPPKGFPFMNAYKSTWTVATLTDLGGERTRLRLTGLGYSADEESQKMRAFFDQGNAYSLNVLKQKLSVAPPAASSNAQAAAAEDPLSPLIAEATVNAMPADVWRHWTTSEGFKAFSGIDNSIELKVGGPFEMYFGRNQPKGERGSEGCTILSYDPERMLSFTWNAPPKFAHARPRHTWVVLTIQPHGGHSSKVTLKHMGFEEQAKANPDHVDEWKQVRAYFKLAWPNVLAKLSDHYAPKKTTEVPK